MRRRRVARRQRRGGQGALPQGASRRGLRLTPFLAQDDLVWPEKRPKGHGGGGERGGERWLIDAGPGPFDRGGRQAGVKLVITGVRAEVTWQDLKDAKHLSFITKEKVKAAFKRWPGLLAKL